MDDQEKTLSLNLKGSKENVLKAVTLYIQNQGFSITIKDEEKPWGAYYYIDEKDREKFTRMYFHNEDFTEIIKTDLRLTPKFLIVAPNEMLSWQWHKRRSEYWSLVVGQVTYKVSSLNEEPEESHELVYGKILKILKETRHRLIGADKINEAYGVVAEIWIHSDPSNPSNEEDIHRVSDKYSRP